MNTKPFLLKKQMTGLLFLEDVSLLPKILYLVCPAWFPSCLVTRIPGKMLNIQLFMSWILLLIYRLPQATPALI